jgi:hypothetical protein
VGFLTLLAPCAIWLGALLSAASGTPQSTAAGEYEIKAAFLYQFFSFVQWPEDTGGASACIAIIGRDPFGSHLDEAVKSRSVNGRPLLVIRSKTGRDLGACRIAFISSSEQKDLASILRKLPPAVLSVGDMPDFCERGGIVGFELSEQRVRIRINLEAAQRGRLQVSSRLLSVAKVVGGVGQ